MKVKALAAGVALALGAGGAHATIATGASGTGPGEFFLSVFDPVAQKSYSQDLGVDMFKFLTDSSYAFYKGNSWSIPLSSVWGQFHNAANDASIVYNVAATDLDNGKFNSLDPTYGYVTSFNTANPVPMPAGDAASVQKPGSVISNRAATYNGPDPANVAQNDAKSWTPPDAAYYANGWGSDFATKVPSSQSNEGKLGQALDVWLHGLAPTLGEDEFGSPIQLDRFEKLPGQFLLTAAELKYSAAAPVPVPAAVWLLGSALAGFVTIGRRGQRV